MISNTAIKRIKADVRELRNSPSDQYVAAPLEDNLFEWHFTVRGPADTAFEGGVYHGRILLPSDYPFKPPNIVFMTPNGRFKVGEKICLSISAHHPEHWQPAWGIRLILEALISFMPTESNGALGSLDWTDEERRELAAASVSFTCPHCGKVADLLPEAAPAGERPAESKYAAEIRQLTLGAPRRSEAAEAAEAGKAAERPSDAPAESKAEAAAAPDSKRSAPKGAEGAEAPTATAAAAAAGEEGQPASPIRGAEPRASAPAPAAAAAAAAPPPRPPTDRERLYEELSKPSAWEDGLYHACTVLAILLLINVCHVVYTRCAPQSRF